MGLTPYDLTKMFMSFVFSSNSFGWLYCGIVTRYVPNPQFLICQIDLIGEPTNVMCVCGMCTGHQPGGSPGCLPDGWPQGETAPSYCADVLSGGS